MLNKLGIGELRVQSSYLTPQNKLETGEFTFESSYLTPQNGQSYLESLQDKGLIQLTQIVEVQNQRRKQHSAKQFAKQFATADPDILES
ncbi:hypothetical protein [Endozoicomonas sp. 4G]|uniref:hypothetical protein n=1 Tax=Endozoicomonas sp. 4G TaxID=2872754 RepID=UPI0020790ED0|nr:hypothetical protein [Endozoicomonas sp. 4G]